MCPLADEFGKGPPAAKGIGQPHEYRNYEETAAELCLRADAEEDFDKLLELAKKLQRFIEARRSGNTPDLPSECHTSKSRMPLGRVG